MTMDEAKLEQTEEGTVAASPGWFVLNLADSRWMRSEEGGEWTDLEPESGFEHYGIGVHVLHPGQPNGMYHSENVQEDFLVLSGECILVVEEEERRLEGLGLLPLRARDEPHHRGGGRGPVRDPDGRRPRRGQEAALPGERGRRPPRRFDARGHRHAERGVSRVVAGIHAGSRHLATLMSEREEELRAATIGELAPLTKPIELVDYDPAWPGLFEREAERIRAALGERAVVLEHTGSTSVPGLAAKPIIDITLAVPDSADEKSYVPALEAAGYVLRIREPDWYEHRVFKGPDTNVNLHVFSEGCPEIDRMVGFRDWIRANRADRELYERTKRELAAKDWKYVQNYADAKTAVVEEIIARAAG